MSSDIPAPESDDELPTELVQTGEVTADGAGGDQATESVAKRRLSPLMITLISVAGVLLVGLVVIVIVLSTSRTSEAIAPRPSPSATTSSGTPTAEPIAIVAPALRIDASCAELIPAPAIALVNSVPLALYDEGTGTPDSLYTAAQREVGIRSCGWRSSPGFGTSGVWLSIRPQSFAEYVENADAWGVDTQYNVYDAVGDDSVYWCSIYGGEYGCSAELLTGQHWTTLSISGTLTGAVTEARVHDIVESLMSAIDSGVRGAGRLGDRWTIPAGALDANAFCHDPEATAVVTSAWGFAGLVRLSGEGTDPVTAAAGGVYCVWYLDQEPYSSVQVSMLPGGAWVLEKFDADPPDTPWLGAPTPVEVPGADRAYVACGEVCRLSLAVHGSLVEVQVSTIDPAAAAAGAAPLVAALLEY